MNVLTVAGARKTFGAVTALDGASFELRQGELLALLKPNGAGKTTLIRAARFAVVQAAILTFAATISGCAEINSQTYSFATLAEARQAGAISKGWVPEGLPSSSHDIRVAQLPGTAQHWGIINFPAADEAALRALLQPSELPLAGQRCDTPGRIEWWPVLLRGELDGERLAATGLRGYRTRAGDRLFAVNWSQGRAYYWGDK